MGWSCESLTERHTYAYGGSILNRMEEAMRKYVALIGHGPRWIDGKSVYAQGKPVEDHLAAMREHYDAGVLQLGGPFDHGGGIAVLDVADEAAARAVMDADPAVLAGVMVYEIRALRPVFDVTAHVRAEGSVATLSKGEPASSRADR